MKTALNRKYFTMEPGDILDDAQYLALSIPRKDIASGNASLLSTVLRDGRTYSAVLRGETEIISNSGIKINTADSYARHLKKGRAGKGKIHMNKMSFIEIRLDGSQDDVQPLTEIVYSVADAIAVLQEKEEGED